MTATLWDVTLTCDHKVLVGAPTAAEATARARAYVVGHDGEPEGEPTPVDAGTLLLIYPGPWSIDAVADLDDHCESDGSGECLVHFGRLEDTDGSEGPDVCDLSPEALTTS